MNRALLIIVIVLLVLAILSAHTESRRTMTLRMAADQALMAARQNLEFADSLLRIIQTKQYCPSYTRVDWP